MKTIANVLSMNLSAAILQATGALEFIEPLFRNTDNIRFSDCRYDVTEALCLLKIERDAFAANDHITIERRLKLAPALLNVVTAMQENAFGFLVGSNDTEGQTILNHVEHFEMARHIISAAHFTLVECMRKQTIEHDMPVSYITDSNLSK